MMRVLDEILRYLWCWLILMRVLENLIVRNDWRWLYFERILGMLYGFEYFWRSLMRYVMLLVWENVGIGRFKMGVVNVCNWFWWRGWFYGREFFCFLRIILLLYDGGGGNLRFFGVEEMDWWFWCIVGDFFWWIWLWVLVRMIWLVLL